MIAFELLGKIALDGAAAVGKSLDEIGKKADTSGSKLASFGDKTSKLGVNLSKFVTTAVTGIGTAVVGMATHIGNAADRILDLRAITGLSTQAIQQYQYAAKIAGTDTEAVTNTMRVFTAQLDQIAKGTGPVAEAFGKLGIETGAFLAMNPDQQMDSLIAALQGIEDPAERARLGVELFSRQWQQLAPIVDLGAEKLRQAREAGEQFAMNDAQLNAANNFRISMGKLQKQIGGVYQELAISLLPAAQSIIDVFQNYGVPAISAFAGVLEAAANLFAALPEPIQAGVVVLAAFAAGAGPVLVILGQIATAVSVLTPMLATLASGGFLLLVSSAATFCGQFTLVVAAVYAVIAVFDIFKPEIKAVGEYLQELGVPIDYLIGQYEKLCNAINYFLNLSGKSRTVTRQLEADPNAIKPGGSTAGGTTGASTGGTTGTGGGGTNSGGDSGGGTTTTQQETAAEREARWRQKEKERQKKRDEELKSIGVKKEVGTRLVEPGGEYIRAVPVGKELTSSKTTNNYDLRGARFNDSADMQKRLARAGAGVTGGFM